MIVMSEDRRSREVAVETKILLHFEYIWIYLNFSHKPPLVAFSYNKLWNKYQMYLFPIHLNISHTSAYGVFIQIYEINICWTHLNFSHTSPLIVFHYTNILMYLNFLHTPPLIMFSYIFIKLTFEYLTHPHLDFFIQISNISIKRHLNTFEKLTHLHL